MKRAESLSTLSGVAPDGKEVENREAPLPAPTATDIEQEHVHKVYDAIAPHFSATRYKAWPQVRAFVEALAPGSLLADIGCGNGKNLSLSESCYAIGCDRSLNLVKVAAGQRLQALVGDAIATPFRRGTFDAALSIAVVHHFASDNRRALAIAELARIVRIGGKILIYVWALEQPKKNRSSAPDVFVPWEMHNKFDGNETVYKRYYHLFKETELEGLCEAAAAAALDEQKKMQPCKNSSGEAIPLWTINVERSYYDKENWCVILIKEVIVPPTPKAQ